MVVSRIARLTLFSGPHCSLCEVAKAELAKVKSQRDFELEVINIQDKGQETWRKKYVYWIPALHLDGVEIAKVDGFIVDTTPSIHPSVSVWHSCIYDRISGAALGEEHDELLPPAAHDLRLCFNCGSPNHAVASCIEPINRQLVSLSRQLFHFYHPDFTEQELTRFHIAEDWKRQRLEWVGIYEPGVIRGPLLRDALGLRDGDAGNAVEWLRNMAYWGYPPGWVGCQDPTELAYHRILGDDDEAPDHDSFLIFEGAEYDEEINLKLPVQGRSPPMATSSVSRWASYPDTYFSSPALSIYNGTPLEKVVSSSFSQVSATFTPERRALWERIISGGLGASGISPVPPWRAPGALDPSSYLDGNVKCSPPPPSTIPPPLPPNLSSLPYTGSAPPDDRSVTDMDLSDDGSD